LVKISAVNEDGMEYPINQKKGVAGIVVWGPMRSLGLKQGNPKTGSSKKKAEEAGQQSHRMEGAGGEG